jgi:hypothetical protein
MGVIRVKKNEELIARVAASEIAHIVDLAFETNCHDVKMFASLLTTRIPALMDGSAPPCCDSDADLRPYILGGAGVWNQMLADEAKQIRRKHLHGRGAKR